MPLAKSHLDVLEAVARHYVLLTCQIHALCFAHATNASVVRRCLSKLVHDGLLNRTRKRLVDDVNPVGASVYYPSEKGLRTLALETGEPAYLLVPTRKPAWLFLDHFVALSDLRILVHRAVAAQDVVTLPAYLNEFDIANPEAVEPERHYRLFTLIRKEPRLLCAPDGAFMLQAGPHRKAYYVELERGTNSPRKAAAEKSPGYAALAEKKLHRERHFPGALDAFNVLVVAPTPSWRDQLRREFGKKEGARLYKFAAWPELTPETFLGGPVWHPCAGEPDALLKRSQGATAGVTPGVTRERAGVSEANAAIP